MYKRMANIFSTQSQINKQLSWLGLSLAAQRNNLAKTLCCLKGIGARAGTSLFLRKSFTRFLEQVAIDKQKELDLLNEIDAVEKQHDHLRQRKLLRRAQTDLPPRPQPPENVENPPARDSKGGILGLIAFFYVFSLTPKKRDLTAN
jgi:hypothetical protein